MFRYVLLAIITVIMSLEAAMPHILTHEDMIKPRKIITLSCSGGSAHNAVSNLIKTTMDKDNVVIVDAAADIVACCFRLIPFLTLGQLKMRETYSLFNYAQQNQWTRTLNYLARNHTPSHFHSYRKIMEKKFIEYFEREKPDMVISAIHYVNYAAAQAAQKLGIPFLVVTLDAELAMWLQDMEYCSNRNVRFGVESLTPHMLEQFTEKNVHHNQIVTLGFPLREDFWTPKDIPAIKAEWNIPNDKKTVMMIRGGNGSAQFLDTVELLHKSPIPLHMVICVGKNEDVAKKLSKLKLPEHLSMTIVPFTKKIADLMAASDALITLPSPTTCSEALHMGLPILFDMTQPTLFWERRTVDWVGPSDACVIVKKERHMVPALMELLRRPRPKIKTHVPKFSVELAKLINTMVPPQKLTTPPCV